MHLQALDFLEKQGQLSTDKRRKIPVTSFRRLVGTPEVRAKLGIDIEDGELRLLGDPKKVAKALIYVIDDLLATEFNREECGRAVI